MSGWGWHSSQPRWEQQHGKQWQKGGWPQQAQTNGPQDWSTSSYQVVTPAKVEEAKMEVDEATGSGKGSGAGSGTDRSGKGSGGKGSGTGSGMGSGTGSGKGSGKGDSDSKVKVGGNSYPCTECGEVFHHREMIISRRAKHGKMREVAPEKLPKKDEEYFPKQEIQYLKICATCELQERRSSGDRDVTLWEVKKDIRRQSRSKEWNARGMFYQQACQEVDVSGLSRSEASKKKSEKCKELAMEFLQLLQKDDLMGVFSDAGRRMQEAMQQWKIMDNLTEQLDNANSQVEEEVLLQKLKEAEARWDEVHGYQTFEDKGELQYRFIKAQDYDDRVSENISRFYVCPHCGSYFFSKFWVKRFRQWYCELDYAKWCQLADAEDVERLKKAWGGDTSKWPVLGCRKLYRPFVNGPGLVIEYKGAFGEWKAFRAELMPEILDDCIKKKQVEFNNAMNCMTPDDVYNMVPRTYPKANPVPLAGFDAFPGLGRFDFVKWQEDNEPVMTTEGWCRLAMQVASKNMDSLDHVFKTAHDYLRSRGLDGNGPNIIYRETGRDAASPLTTAVHVDNQF